MPRRVFLGLTEIAGYYGNLAHGLQELGVGVTRVDLSGHRFAYPTSGASSALARLRTRLTNRVVRGILRVAQQALVLFVFVAAAVRCDVFVFGYATSFFGYRELPLLRLLRKRIVFVFHGSDSRAPYLDGAEMAPELGRSHADCVALTAARKARLRRIERYADVIVANPLSAHLHERPIVPFLWLGIPTPPSEHPRPPARNGPVRALHAPSQPSAKGSSEIRAACAEAGVELDEVHGVPHAVVLERLEACDFVVDQVYSDTPMAGFAVEAARAGRPAIVGGYGWASLRGERLPTELCAPDEIEAAIRRLANDPERRRELGERAARFVEEKWAARAVAARLLEALDGRAPLADPRDLREHRGAGLAEEAARRLVAGVIAAGGVEALQLDDKPELRRRLVEFAGEDSPR